MSKIIPVSSRLTSEHVPAFDRTRRAAWLAAAALGVLASPAAAQGPRVLIAGGDDLAWAVFAGADTDSDSGLPINDVLASRRFMPSDRSSAWQREPSIVGDIRMATATRDALYLAFSDGSLAQRTARGTDPVARLPTGCVLNAWAGDASGDAVFAAVHVSPDLLATATTTSASAAETSETQPTSAPTLEPGPQILRLARGEWTQVAHLPAEAPPATPTAIAVRENRVILLYVDREPALARTWEWNDADWNAAELPEELARNDVQRWWLGWRSQGPALLTLHRSEVDQPARSELWQRADGNWNRLGTLTEAPGRPAALREPFAAGFAHDRLLLARHGEKGQFDLGWAPIKSDATVQFTALNLGQATQPRPWISWLNTLAMFALLAFLFLVRPERLYAPVRLAPHWTLALPTWRILAAVLDLLPAVVLTAAWWAPPLMKLATSASVLTPEQIQVETDARFWVVRLYVLPVYAVYCLVWEATLGTTPGKYLLGCRVIDEEGGRPSAQRLIIRNVMRIVELGLVMVLLCDLFLVLVASQRRQRIGDLLAGTLVVSPAVAMARPAEPTATERDEDTRQKRD